MFKSQDMILICIIVILIIVIFHCKNNKKEGFVSTEIFNPENLDTVKTKIKNETDTIKEIKNKFTDIIKRNEIQYYVKNEEGTYQKADKNDENVIELGTIIDINNMVKLNSDLGQKLKNIPYNRYYEETVKGAIQKRIRILNDEIIKQKQEEILEASKLNKFPIKNIKHIDTSVMFNLENVDNNTYKVKYITDNNNPHNEKCSDKCLTFDVNKYSDENSDYYSFEDCEYNNDMQKLEVNNIKLDYKCYNIKTNEEVNKPLEECDDDLTTYINNDEQNYINKYNELIPKELHITKNNLNYLPNEFTVITPTEQPPNEPKQCLTVDNEGLSFQDCDLFEHQRFNYEREILDKVEGV